MFTKPLLTVGAYAGGARGEGVAPPKKANLTQIEKKEGKKSQTPENLPKLPQCRLQMGQK